MNIEIKKSIKPIKYDYAMKLLETRLTDIYSKQAKDLIWILEHEEVYTAGTSFNKDEILNKSIKYIETNRGGKVTFHGPGQIICYFVIDLKKRKKDIRKLITLIEKTIIESLLDYDIRSFGDPKNIGIWIKHQKEVKKIAAIGIRVSKWIAYHGFAINVNNDLSKYNNIVPCGIKDKVVTNLKEIKDLNYKNLNNLIIKNFIKNLEI
ncbi:lipoyl(octanoyl) transferase LipB [Candidatus Pelagibacter sp.]|nr:lipoyl(octanoyl) transferase LipB [Candidatus Pelagibacter sp.]